MLDHYECDFTIAIYRKLASLSEVDFGSCSIHAADQYYRLVATTSLFVVGAA